MEEGKKGKKRPAADEGGEAAAPKKKAAKGSAAGGGGGAAAEPAHSAAPSGGGGAPQTSAKLPSVTGNPATDEVLEYLRKQNRPYSSIQIEDNLHKRLSRKQIDLCIDELAALGHVVKKEFGKAMVAWYNQAGYEAALTDLETTASDAQAAQVRAQDLSSRRKGLEGAVKSLESAPKLSDLSAKVADLRAKRDALSARVSAARSSSAAGTAYTAQDKTKAIQTLEKFRKAWGGRKAIVQDVVDALCDGAEDSKLTPKAVLASMGISTDEEAGCNLKDMATPALAAKLAVPVSSLMVPPKPGKGGPPPLGGGGGGGGGPAPFRPPPAAKGGGAKPGPAAGGGAR